MSQAALLRSGGYWKIDTSMMSFESDKSSNCVDYDNLEERVFSLSPELVDGLLSCACPKNKFILTRYISGMIDCDWLILFSPAYINKIDLYVTLVCWMIEC
jgi:hypothetical protein